MDPVVARHAARAVPRYTSYPSAPHFQAGFPEAHYRTWLGALDPREPVSLYLHVPFCREMCWYCGCNMKLARRYEPIAAYVEVLLKELDLVAAALPARMTISHLHWGGGTPTALQPADLARVMEAVRRKFTIDGKAELAIESDPRTLTAEMTHLIGALGFTRASFGVQEFNPRVQQAINRVQPPEMVERAVDGLRDAGVRALNFDLIYGLPFQTGPSLVATVSAAAAMAPDRLALFGYAHVPWMARNQRMIPEAALPGPAERAEQAALAAETLTACGFDAIGIDHFAQPHDELALAAREGRMRRNFQGYTTDRANTLIGLGATAIGTTPFGHVQNLSETRAWARAVEAGRLPVGKGLAFRGEDRMRAHVIERIMCDGRADVGEAGRRFGAAPDWAAESLSALGDLVADGLVVIDGPEVALTPRGRPLARVVAAAFDTYLESGAARHSQAV
ncbi:oxygen-independent coproporphyrinogen III oxidase [Thermaurantiacus sp.]